MTSPYMLTRRRFIQVGAAMAGIAAIPTLARAALPELNFEQATRSLQFYNTHTGESLKTTYWEMGNYNNEALKDISYVLRDHRTNDMEAINPNLLDLLNQLHAKLGSAKPFEVISGYRSPRTNAALHAHSNGVASKSLHMQGMAIDIRLTDRKLTDIRDVALNMQRGGVGYYASSNFVHVDVGNVRRW